MSATQFPTEHASGALYGELDPNECRQQLSYAYVHAVATAARCHLNRPSVDYQTIDATVGQTGRHSRIEMPKVDLQLKCTSKGVLKDQYLHYQLEKKYYDALRSTMRGDDIILVVMLVPTEIEDWLLQAEPSLILHKAAYWISLRDAPPILSESKTVKIPRSNVFNVEQLLEILGRIGSGGHP